MTLLVLGAGGQLGAELLAAASAGGRPVVGLGHGECDITDPASVDRALSEHRPTAVVNCAAWTAVDAAEDHPEDARRVNALGAGNVADACQRHGARLCHVSTDYVFDGAGGSALNEDATPHPLSVYGASKLAGEDTVRERCRDHLIARTSWVFGQRGPNFVLTVLTLIDSGSNFVFQIGTSGGGTPGAGTFTIDVVGAPANDDCSQDHRARRDSEDERGPPVVRVPGGMHRWEIAAEPDCREERESHACGDPRFPASGFA